MNDDRSILRRLEELGMAAPRVDLDGSSSEQRSEERYEVVGEIARGGVGVVHKGRDNDLGRDVALKLLRDDHLANPDLVQRFIEEAQIAGQLQHPGIVTVYELGMRADRRPFFAMKLVKGETLAARLAKRSNLTEERRALLAIFREVCRTMAYAHARGVIHRDLKPSNVMIGNFGEVQVVDWGFAKVLTRGGLADERLARKAEIDVTMISTVRSDDESSSDSVAGSVMGTPGYMPPEQAMGRVDDLDEKSDIFSLGAILCEILTGEPPYTGTTEERMTAARRARVEDAHERVRTCGADDRLIKICRHALEPLPKDRPQSAQTVGNEVAASLTANESRAHRAQLRAIKAKGRADEQRRTRRQTALIVTGALVLVLLGIGVWLWIDADSTHRENERRTAIAAAFRDATLLRSANRWQEALDAAERGIELGGNSAMRDSLRAEAAEHEAEARHEKEDDALLAELETIRTLYRGGSTIGSDEDAEVSSIDGLSPDAEDRAVDAAFTAAFERVFGSVSNGRDRLVKSGRARELASCLGFWTFLRKDSPALEGTDWTTLHRLACDIDPQHAPVRNSLAVVKVDALIEAARVEGDDLALGFVSEIGLRLERAGLADEALEFLSYWKKRHPGDYWLNIQLAVAASRAGDVKIAMRSGFAAVALRPRSAAAWIRLGLRYAEAYNFVDGDRAIRRALELDPNNRYAPAARATVAAARAAREEMGR